MHYEKIDYSIVIILIVRLRFVVSAFLMANMLETTPAEKSKLLQKL